MLVEQGVGFVGLSWGYFLAASAGPRDIAVAFAAIPSSAGTVRWRGLAYSRRGLGGLQLATRRKLLPLAWSALAMLCHLCGRFGTHSGQRPRVCVRDGEDWQRFPRIVRASPRSAAKPLPQSRAPGSPPLDNKDATDAPCGRICLGSGSASRPLAGTARTQPLQLGVNLARIAAHRRPGCAIRS